ncbi:MAG TPA: 3-hydroxyacyl-CoA dehydrogenase NAD-binding domain-containing protein, partial [Vicinamibacteria bacterium]|nr:3-hydroxyacyl-CoA dehydrogenase NAD-binding domain-containing protein [Vicinamibacteria bacterium]
LAMGLPEVTLGFVPGAGGTQRLPRLVGLEAALDLILSGRRVAAEEALRLGLVDQVAPLAALRERAIALAEEVANGRPRRTGALPVLPAPDGLFERYAAELARGAPGRRAPSAALECLRLAAERPLDEGLLREREVFLELVQGPESRALRHVFFAEREARKVAGVPADAVRRPIRTAGVVGFGTMGSGIAMVFANAGLPVRVLDSSTEAVDRGLAKVEQTYASARAKGRLSVVEMETRLRLVQGVTEYGDLASADIVVEAVFEEIDLKRDVLQRLDGVCRADAILATNTSSLDVDALAAATVHPERVLGLHFFSPAHVMPLVEVVRPASVAGDVVATALELVQRLGKVGVVVGVCDGFAGNRMLFAYRRQADFLLEEGASPQQVDRALREFGLPMGPYQMGDLTGLDVSWRIRKRQAASRPAGWRYSPIADRLCERGRFGQKTGAGWYRYASGDRTPIPDPETDALIRAVSAELGIARREIADAEIVDRCLHPLVNEGARLLEEGLVARASDLDVIWIHGYGFPRHRGGPMHWADEVGLARVAATVQKLHAEQGGLVTPSPLLVALAHEGRTFDSLGPGARAGAKAAPAR